MEWEGREESENVEDRRTFGTRTLAIGGGAGAILIVILGLVFGVDPGETRGRLKRAESAQRRFLGAVKGVLTGRQVRQRRRGRTLTRAFRNESHCIVFFQE
jgi:predicted metalloprotease